MPRRPALLAALLLLQAATAWGDGGQARVLWQDGRLSVSADGVALEEVLELVAGATEMPMDLRGRFPEPVRVDFAGVPLREGVTRILAAAPGTSYAMVDYQDPDTGAKRIALSVGRPGAASAAPASGIGAELETAPRRPRPGARQLPVENPPASGSPPPAPAPTSTPGGDPIGPANPGPAPRR